ncbi:hypothetical protein FQR65_LT17873 [Abscondita terminalis]|nr:hypothetical protein FQR65_LT17873 [Abscondita terminalis]
MAKKAQEISVEDKLRALYDLQIIDSRLDEIRNTRGELPIEVEDLEIEIEGLNKRAAKFSSEIKDLQDQIKAKKEAGIALAAPLLMNAQNVMTPEKLWTLGKFSVQAVAPDQSSLIYKVGITDLKTEKTNAKSYFLDLLNNSAKQIDFGKKAIIQWDKNGLYAKEGGVIYISKDKGNTWSEFYKIGVMQIIL